MFAQTPPPPYYAVIFTSQRRDNDPAGYADAAERMLALVATQPGFLGVESVRNADGLGITVSYWESEQAIVAWRDNAEHAAARAKGHSTWYAALTTRVARVERAYGFTGQTMENAETPPVSR
jgi:heme-degrading monooxygenase HmoA